MISKYIDLKNNSNYSLLKEPANAIFNGNLVLFPTETVYGIGANALDSTAVSKIFVAKGRASDNPLIVHISDLRMLDNLVSNIGEIEKKLMETFWPGPLTIILEKKDIIPANVTAGLDTVAIRMPSNEIARNLINMSNVPIAAPSANVSGKPSGTTVNDIIQELDGKVDYMIDGGMTDIGVESTVIRVIDGIVHILRPGKISREQIEELGLQVAVEKQVLGEYNPNEKILSPGIKYRHYAPNSKCLLVYSDDNDKLVNKINELIRENSNVVGNNPTTSKLLILCKESNMSRYNTPQKLSMGGTLDEISHNLFNLLRKVDSYSADLVIIEGVTKNGLGLAIMNRLLRACSHNYIQV